MTESIARTKTKLGNTGYKLPATSDLCIQALARCTWQLKAALKDKIETNQLQQKHQETLIQAHEVTGNTKMAKRIRGMKRAEEVKSVFQRCQAARQTRRHEGGLTHVLLPVQPEDNTRSCEEWKRVECPHEMTRVLLEHNRAHFGQSKGCPLTAPPLDFTMSFSATCERADAILEGTFLQPTTTQTPQALIDDSDQISSEPDSNLTSQSQPSHDDDNDSWTHQAMTTTMIPWTHQAIHRCTCHALPCHP